MEIQAAVDYAREHYMVVYFPSGTYRVSNTIWMRAVPRYMASGHIPGMFIKYFSLYSVNVQCEGFAKLTFVLLQQRHNSTKDDFGTPKKEKKEGAGGGRRRYSSSAESREEAKKKATRARGLQSERYVPSALSEEADEVSEWWLNFALGSLAEGTKAQALLKAVRAGPFDAGAGGGAGE